MAYSYVQTLHEFSFNAGSLPQRLEQESDISLTGYWYHRFQLDRPGQMSSSWYLGLRKGQIIFADNQPLSAERLLEIAECYLPKLRSREIKKLTQNLKQRSFSDGEKTSFAMVPMLLSGFYSLNLIQPQEFEQALRLKILQDLDDVLFDYAGNAKFVPSKNLFDKAPIPGFNLQTMVAEARRRKLIWDKVKTLIPSRNSPLEMNHEMIQKASLDPQYVQQLTMLISHGDTINTIARSLGKDTLEIAKGLAQLVNKGLLMVKPALKQGEPEIFILDDSPVILKQFTRLVTGWGYQVRSHVDPNTALDAMLESNPVAIFLDINMPGLSGFDVLKQIRRQPSLAAVPLIMLTAERNLSNNWRAQWSGCQFLSKPLSTDEISRFKHDLRLLIEATIS